MPRNIDLFSGNFKVTHDPNARLSINSQKYGDVPDFINWCTTLAETISGKSDFNETFLTGVVIPDSQRIGAVGEGFDFGQHFMTLAAGESQGSGHMHRDPGLAHIVAFVF